VGQKSGYFNAKDKNRSKTWDHLYKDEILTNENSKDNDDGFKWIEYEIVFIDPGVYVSTWDAEINFSDASKEAIVVASMEGIDIGSYTLLTNQRKVKIKIPIPPDYGKPIRLRIKTVNGDVMHKSIKIIPPGNKEPFVISKIASSSK
jgi:beta-glucosidase